HAEVGALIRRLFGAHFGHDEPSGMLATTVRFNNLEVAGWLRQVAGTYSDTKRIPEFLYEQEELAILRACLQGLFNGDGTFTVQAPRKSGTLSISTVSEKLAYQLRHVCLRWGIKSSLNVRDRAERQRAYEVIWCGESAHRLSHLLLGEDVIQGNRSFELSWTDEDYLYQPVVSNEPEDYDGLVYNFSVEEDESYTLAAGFVVHNCDFFKNNAYFAHTSRKMMDEMANHGARVRRYVERYGEDEVEQFLDRCMSIDDLIDVHSTAIRRRDPVSRYDFPPPGGDEDAVKLTRFKSKAYMDDYINP